MGFMDKVFETVIVFSAVDMVTPSLMKMAGSVGMVNQRSKEMQATLNNYRNLAFVGAAITGVGAAIATGLVKAADAAGQLQTAMMGVKTAMGLTNDEFQKAMNMSMTMGIPTIFSAQQVGGIMAAAANAGMTKSAVLNPDIMRQYVNFADVQAQGTKQEDPNTVIAAAVKMTNLAQISGVQNTATFLDQLNAALMHTTDTATQFATNMRYYTGTAQLMGMSSGDILTTNAWLSRMGLGGGRGGMAMQQFLSRSIYGSSGTAADKAMVQAGFVVNGRSVFEDAKGAFVGIPATSKALQDFGKRFHEDSATMLPLLKDIFGVTGERVAMAMANPAAATQYTNVQQQIQSTAGINTTQAAYNATWQGQMRQMTTTLQDIWIQFGRYAMTNLLPTVEGLNKLLSSILGFMQAHPVIMNLITDFLKWGAAIGLVVGPAMTFIGVIGWIGKSGYILTGIQMIGKAFTLLGNITKITTAIQWLFNTSLLGCPVVWIIVGLAAIGVAIYELVTHWKEVITWIQNTWNLLKNSPLAWFVATPLMALLGGLDLLITHWKDITTAIQDAWNWLTKWNSTPQAQARQAALANAHIPGHAAGTRFAPGGWSLVGEKGPELLNIPTGSQVISNASLTGMLGGVNMGDVNINIYPTPNQSPTAIAKAASKELGSVIRNGRRCRTTTPVPAW